MPGRLPLRPRPRLLALYGRFNPHLARSRLMRVVMRLIQQQGGPHKPQHRLSRPRNPRWAALQCSQPRKLPWPLERLCRLPKIPRLIRRNSLGLWRPILICPRRCALMRCRLPSRPWRRMRMGTSRRSIRDSARERQSFKVVALFSKGRIRSLGLSLDQSTRRQQQLRPLLWPVRRPWLAVACLPMRLRLPVRRGSLIARAARLG